MVRRQGSMAACISAWRSFGMSASVRTASALRLPRSASAAHSGERSSAMRRASLSSRAMVLPETLRPVCRSMMAAFTSSTRMPESEGSSERRRTASPLSASVAAARSVTVSARVK